MTHNCDRQTDGRQNFSQQTTLNYIAWPKLQCL